MSRQPVAPTGQRCLAANNTWGHTESCWAQRPFRRGSGQWNANDGSAQSGAAGEGSRRQASGAGYHATTYLRRKP